MATVPAVAFSIILFCDIMMLLLFTLIFKGEIIMPNSKKNTSNLISDIIVDETRNHGLNTSALIQFLAIKGIIDIKEFNQYLDSFSIAFVKNAYPELFE